jgi:hypothetical protein
LARKRTQQDRKLALESLFRVRAVENPPDASGEKEVWHQGTKGADLFSVVNRTGHVTRQEFVLFEDYFVWTKQGGLKTGSCAEARGIKDVVAASDEIQLDAEIDDDRVARARETLSTYGGADKYLLHLKAVISLAAAGTEAGELSAVTNAMPALSRDRAAALAASASAAPPPTPLSAPAVWPYLVGGAGVGLLLVGLVWLFMH